MNLYEMWFYQRIFIVTKKSINIALFFLSQSQSCGFSLGITQFLASLLVLISKLKKTHSSKRKRKICLLTLWNHRCARVTVYDAHREHSLVFNFQHKQYKIIFFKHPFYSVKFRNIPSSLLFMMSSDHLKYDNSFNWSILIWLWFTNSIY
jgi:hypothetical protein